MKSYLSNRYLIITIIGAGFAALVAIISLQQYVIASDQTPQTFTDTISEGKSIVQISSDSADSSSADKDIQANVEDSGMTLAVVLTNNAATEKEIVVDSWEASLYNDDWSFSEELSIDTKLSIPPGSSTTIANIDLSKYEAMFEKFPGHYTFQLTGWRWYDKDMGEFKKRGNWEDVHILADVTVGYDVGAIKDSANKFLKSENMLISLDGPGDPFKIEENSSEKLSLYLTNTGKEARSSAIQSSTMYIWNSENRFPGLVTNSVAELDPGKCQALEPGEDKMVESVDLSKDKWPLGGTGMAEILEVNSPPPGIYFVYYEATTSDCNLDDGSVAKGENYSSIVAVEVE